MDVVSDQWMRSNSDFLIVHERTCPKLVCLKTWLYQTRVRICTHMYVQEMYCNINDVDIDENKHSRAYVCTNTCTYVYVYIYIHISQLMCEHVRTWKTPYFQHTPWQVDARASVLLLGGANSLVNLAVFSPWIGLFSNFLPPNPGAMVSKNPRLVGVSVE